MLGGLKERDARTRHHEAAAGEEKTNEVAAIKPLQRGNQKQVPEVIVDLTQEVCGDGDSTDNETLHKGAVTSGKEVPIWTLAEDGLVTTIARIDCKDFELTIGNGARYSIVGERLNQTHASVMFKNCKNDRSAWKAFTVSASRQSTDKWLSWIHWRSKTAATSSS